MALTVTSGHNRTLGEQWADALENAATAKVDALRLKRKADRIFDRVYLATSGSNMREREARTAIDDRVEAAFKDWEIAESTAIVAKAKADAAEAIFEEWRSRQATQRAELTALHG